MTANNIDFFLLILMEKVLVYYCNLKNKNKLEKKNNFPK